MNALAKAGWALGLVLGGCGGQVSNGGGTLLPAPDGAVSLVSFADSHGGAAGFIVSRWALRFGTSEGADVLITSVGRNVAYDALWTGPRTLRLCLGNEPPPPPRLDFVTAETPQGQVRVTLDYDCGSASEGRR
jgi:hypothetical protein